MGSQSFITIPKIIILGIVITSTNKTYPVNCFYSLISFRSHSHFLVVSVLSLSPCKMFFFML